MRQQESRKNFHRRRKKELASRHAHKLPTHKSVHIGLSTKPRVANGTSPEGKRNTRNPKQNSRKNACKPYGLPHHITSTSIKLSGPTEPFALHL